MKTLFTIVGGVVVLGSAGAAFYHFIYLPTQRKISYEKIDYLAKSVDWKTSFSSGTISIDQLKSGGDIGVTKGNDDLQMKRLSDNVIRFTLSRDGKILQQDDIDFIARNIPR